jgi:hypothetical protein
LYIYNGASWVSVADTTLTYTPCFHVNSSSGNVTIAAGAVIPFNIINIDIGSNFNTSLSRFVAPVAGTYFFGTSYYPQGATSICFNKNAVQVYQPSGSGDLNPLITSAAAGYVSSSSIVLSLALNDYVDVRSRNIQSSPIYAAHSSFWGYRLF